MSKRGLREARELEEYRRRTGRPDATPDDMRRHAALVDIQMQDEIRSRTRAAIPGHLDPVSEWFAARNAEMERGHQWFVEPERLEQQQSAAAFRCPKPDDPGLHPEVFNCGLIVDFDAHPDLLVRRHMWRDPPGIRMKDFREV